MKNIFFPANERGYAKHDWLESYFSFSFASYYNPANIHFGMLRVLNDDIVAPAKGFGMHPHDNMEIITILLSGSLEHKDNMGNKGIIQEGDVQVMSAGTGVLHSEYNADDKVEAKLLQLWMFPNKKNVSPRYEQRKFLKDERNNKLLLIVAPNEGESNLWIHQDAWFYLANLEANKSVLHKIQKKGNGIYLFVIKGQLVVNEQTLNDRDAIGISDLEELLILAKNDAEFLLIDLPLQQ